MKFLLTFASLILALSANADVKSTDMVVATVNNQAITLQELKERITLSKVLINKELSKSEFDILKNQAIEQLVKEELVRQYTESKKITVSSKDLNNAIATIEKQRKLEPGSLFKKLPEDLVPSATEQIKNSIREQKIVEKVIISKLYIPEYEIQVLLDNVLKQAHSKEYLISQILINKTDNQPQDARKIAKIYEQLMSGEKFDDLVIAYSDGPNKLKGGELGWFAMNELNYQLQKSVKKLAKGEFSKPAKGSNGWFIVKLNDIKVTENIDTSEKDEFKYTVFSTDKISRDKANEIRKLANNVRGYTDYKKFEKTLAETYNVKVLPQKDWLVTEQVPQGIKQAVESTLPGQFSTIKQNEDKSLKFVYMVDKQVRISNQVKKIKKRIERNLQAQKAERKFKQLMKKLRSDAFIELR